MSDLERLPVPVITEPTRLGELESYYLDIADKSTPLSRGTSEFIRHGGSLRLCLNEIIELSEPTPQDKLLESTRADYMRAVQTMPRLRSPKYRARKITLTETPYVEAFVAKVASAIDAHTPQDALDVQQLPTIVEHASFDENKPSNLERLAGNHLYILMDAALKEHIARRNAIEMHRNRNPGVRLFGDRRVRAAIAGSIFLASISPKIGMTPLVGQTAEEDVELGLKVLSGSVLGMDGYEILRMQLLGYRNENRTQELQEEMASNRRLTDLAFRIIYGSTRYGGSSDVKVVTARCGADDKEENLRRFERMESDFEHLNNDPGGKPYEPWQAQGYAARLLIERSNQLEDLLVGKGAPDERRERFLDLTREIITEDITRMKKGLSVSKLRKSVMRCIAIVPATLFPSAGSLASEASTLGRDTAKVLKPNRKQ